VVTRQKMGVDRVLSLFKKVLHLLLLDMKEKQKQKVVTRQKMGVDRVLSLFKKVLHFLLLDMKEKEKEKERARGRGKHVEMLA
jgi:hypothetical protein